MHQHSTVIPLKIGRKILIVIVMHKAHRERVDAADPMMVPFGVLQSVLKEATCTHLHDAAVMIAYEEDEEAFTAFCLANFDKPKVILQHLQRGRKEIAGDGDPMINLSALMQQGGGLVH